MTGRAVVIGVGNEFRRDDGVGPAVVARLRHRGLPGVRLVECDGETGRLLELWRDTTLAIIVDAVRTEHPVPGTVHRISLRHPGRVGRGTSSHAADLGEAVELARALGRLPEVLLLYAVEAGDTSFGVDLSAPVAAAAVRLADEIAQGFGADLGSAGPEGPNWAGPTALRAVPRNGGGSFGPGPGGTPALIRPGRQRRGWR